MRSRAEGKMGGKEDVLSLTKKTLIATVKRYIFYNIVSVRYSHTLYLLHVCSPCPSPSPSPVSPRPASSCCRWTGISDTALQPHRIYPREIGGGREKEGKK